MARDRLVIVQLDAVELDRRTVTMSTKTLHALELYAEQWPGPLVVSAVVKRLPPSPLLVKRRLADLPFDVVDRSARDVQTLRTGAAATLAMHDIKDSGGSLFDPGRLVLYGEIPLEERIRMASLGRGRLSSLRIALSWRRRAPALRRMVRNTGGYQANGYPVFDTYGELSPRPLLYVDSRATEKIIAHATARISDDRAQRALSPFTLGFSGRHTAAKGIDHALDAVLTLLDEGEDLRLVLYGSGELSPVLRERAARHPGHIEFRGDVDFESTWVRDVPRTVDLMLLPHVQGDPSGTYLESAALGVPVLGFDNVALEALVRHHGIGWTVPLGDTAALTAAVKRLSREPHRLESAGEAGRAFMAEHTFEKEFLRRIRHLREVAGV